MEKRHSLKSRNGHIINSTNEPKHRKLIQKKRTKRIIVSTN